MKPQEEKEEENRLLSPNGKEEMSTTEGEVLLNQLQTDSRFCILQHEDEMCRRVARIAGREELRRMLMGIEEGL
jgi:hypothetical protein